MANEHSQIVPSMQPTAKVADFKFWCQKVLPLVYDDSLSYYEVLNKMVVYLNQVIDNINADIDNVAELKDDFLLLQEYVNNFFDDIDQLVTYTERAEAAQTAAATSAINAASSASNAATSAANAASSSGSAATSALSALDAKNAAVAAKTAAEAALANAQTAANNAAASATAASNSADAASGSAINAAASAASALQNFQLSDAARVAAQQAANDAEAAAELIDMDATASDVGKAIIVKTVEDGKVSAYEFGESGGGGTGGIVNVIEDVPLATFDDGTDAPVEQLIVEITASQEGSGDPAPDNVRNINGYSAIKIEQFNSYNIFDGILEIGGISTSNGGNIPQTDRQRSKNYIPFKQRTSFYFYVSSAIDKTVFFYSANKTLIGYQSLGVSNIVFSAPVNTEYIRFIIRTTNSVDICINANNPILNNNHYPYGVETSYEIALPTESGVVYNGVLNIPTKQLTVNSAKIVFDGTISDFAFAAGSTANRIQWTPYSAIGIPNAYFMSDKLKPAPFSSGIAASPWLIYNTISDPRMNITVPTTITSVNDFVAYTQTDPITVIYPLATPLEYTLTSAEIINILNGINTIWCNSGNIIKLKYYANSKKYIDAQDALIKTLIAKELPDMTADTALVANDFRIVNNTLYRITAPVASGGTLTPGTNCVATTIGEVLKTLLT